MHRTLEGYNWKDTLFPIIFFFFFTIFLFFLPQNRVRTHPCTGRQSIFRRELKILSTTSGSLLDPNSVATMDWLMSDGTQHDETPSSDRLLTKRHVRCCAELFLSTKTKTKSVCRLPFFTEKTTWKLNEN